MGFSLNDYNQHQRQSIAHGDGPFLVISGAGTGKTKLLTGRILHLILEKQVPFENILALTFTEKAAQEMLVRAERELPIGYGELCIKTFHAFCDQVLRERGHEIGLPVDFVLLGEVDLWMFTKRHLPDFKLEYYRPLGNPQKFLHAMLQHFSRLQDENILPERYEAFTKEALKKAENDAQREEALKHQELAKAYGKYQNLLVKNNVLDFGGLLFHTLRLFEKRPSILAEYQKRFQYILVDEFQDTNFAQNKIVTLLAAAHKNLFVVGDDDQSIYKWRGASLTNIAYFQKLFPKAKKIVLNENYRSHQTILDLSYRIIQKNNPNRLEVEQSVDKRLISTIKQKGIIPEIHRFPSLDEEVDFMISKAIYAMKQGKNTAILIRSNALAAPFIERLKFAQFPYQHFSQSALFGKAGVKDCLAALKVIADPQDDQAFFRLVSLSFWKIPMEKILALVREAKQKCIPVFTLMVREPFTPIKKIFDVLIEYSRNHSISEVLKAFFDQSDFIKNISTEKNAEMATDIALFSEKIREFEQIYPHKSVIEFLEYAGMLEETGDRSSSETPLDPHALKILTIHGAKGLEFDTVLIPGLVQGKFPSIARRDMFNIPQALIEEPLPESDHHLEEERRLFYVACTRAKSELIFSYSDFYEGKKQWKPSVFIAEALETGKSVMGIASNKMRLKSTAIKSQQQLPLDQERSHRPVKLTIPKLSYSQLDTFRTCPLKYQFRYLFQIPVPMPSIVHFGSSIHNTLRDFYALLQKNPKLWEENLLPQLKTFYEKNWISLGYESRSIQEDQKNRGWIMTECFYKKEKKEKPIPKFLEKSFMLSVENVTVNGRIDRIDRLEDGTYEVIDYKTGSSEKNLEKDLQLSLYALACRDALKIPVSRLSFYFLDGLEKVSTTRNDLQLDMCREEILECAREISQSDFSPVPGYHCRYCDYRLLCPVAMPLKT
ncbi:UvrD-helicase domain-containing protein [Candidatus Peregrinibacteria bacterium]|nr:UvrD-helicase domain-containing protein [Candidatus Peregrinibacteria bacterium]